MKKITRILLFSSILLMFVFGYINYFTYAPPINNNNYHEVSYLTLIDHKNDYEGYKIVIYGKIDNITETEKIIVFYSSIENLTLNCSQIDISKLYTGQELYFRGISYLESKGYILVDEYKIITSFSLELSLIGLVIVFLILFFVLKFNWKSFSFEIREVKK